MSVNFLERRGVVQKEMQALVSPEQGKGQCVIGVIGLGLEMHFDWALCKQAYSEAIGECKKAVPAAAQMLCAPEPQQTKADVLNLLNAYKAQGMSGLVIYHASFIDGAVALAS